MGSEAESCGRHASRDGDMVTPCGVCAIRKMHSFDRGIKSAHQHKNPDLDENVPSYMRQTCASLVKRNTFKFKYPEVGPFKSSKTKECAKKGTKLNRKKSKSLDEGQAGRSRSRSRASVDGKTENSSASPRSELSAVTEIAGASSESPRGHLSNSSSVIPENEVAAYEAEGVDCKEAVSKLVEECYENVIPEALTSAKASPITLTTDAQFGARGPSVSSNMTLEYAYSEVAPEESFCCEFESGSCAKDGTHTDSALYLGSFFQSTVDSVAAPSTPVATGSAKLGSGGCGEDVFGVMEDAKWLEDGSDDDEDAAQLGCHRLSDILASFTDSEYGGDDAVQEMLEKRAHSATDSKDAAAGMARSSGSSEFDIPIHASDGEKCGGGDGGDDNSVRPFFASKSKKLSTTERTFRIQAPGLFWMLGGNVLAGVLGAAIASTGMPSEHNSAEVEKEVSTPRSDGVHADDWFFQAAARPANDE